MGSGRYKSHEAFELSPAPAALSYKTTAAFDAALKDRFASAANATGHSIADLRRQFAYDRLLTRLFGIDHEHWVLKGGTGLLARLPGQARHSMDIDLYYQGEIDALDEDLAAAAKADIGDHFSFRIKATGSLGGIHPGRKYKATAFVGVKEFATFGIDAVIATNMTGAPEAIPPLSPINVDGLPTAAYRAYPVADLVADKHAAMLSDFNGAASTRYRDLVDLTIVATTHEFDANELHDAIFSEYAHRGLQAPTTINLPSPAWVDGYASAVQDAPEVAQRTADEAIDVVRAMLEPVLNGTASGRWDPTSRCWADQ